MPPGGRWNHSVVHEPLRNTLVIVAGVRGTLNRSLALIDLNTFETLEPTLMPSLPSRRDFSVVRDPRRRQAIVFGGAFESSFAYGDTWVLRLP